MRHYLLVDDNRALAENLAEIFDNAGATATLASGGAHAVELARATRFDAVVSDMRMPVMGGATLVHLLRQVDPGLPAIVVTAYTGDDELADARREGLLAVLPKPVPVARLLELVALARRDALVALIEDDAALADNLTEALRDRGFSAVTAASVLEAERFGDLRPLAALVDVRVPGGPPGEAIRRFAARFPDVPLVAITAFAPELPRLNLAAVYTKPFDTARLLAELERLQAAPR